MLCSFISVPKEKESCKDTLLCGLVSGSLFLNSMACSIHFCEPWLLFSFPNRGVVGFRCKDFLVRRIDTAENRTAT